MAYREKDLIKRALERLAPVLARALGFKDAGQSDEALAELERGAQVAFGLGLGPLGVLTPASAAALLRDPALVRAYAGLVRAEADVREAAGEAARAEALRARAAALEKSEE